MNEEKKVNHPYKIMSGDMIKVRRDDYKGKAYYKAIFSKQDVDGTIIFGRKAIKFNKGVEFQDGDKIIVKYCYEDFYKKDGATVWTVFIKDFEPVDVNEAIEQYNMEISDEDLPF